MLSARDHHRNKQLDLANKALARHRIYLDQKYWISMREARCGNPEKPEHADIYQSLLSLVSAGKVICPICYTVFEETLSIQRYQTRILHAETIDELSLGITIKPPFTLDGTEILHFIRKNTLGEDKVYPLDSLVWDGVAYVMGAPLPSIESYGDRTNYLLQKRYLEHMDNLTFRDIMEQIGDSSIPCAPYDTAEHAKIQTENQRKFEHEFTAFEDVYLSEVAGTLDSQEEDIRALSLYLWENDCKSTGLPPTNDQIDEIARQTRNLIYHALRLKRVPKCDLPGINILAGLYAAKRFKSKGQQGPYAKKGDIRDHLHARAALPYCHAFFTERKMGLFLTEKPLEYDKAYDCAVLWEESDILQYLNRL